MASRILPNANEESTYAVDVSFFNENDVAVTPSAATWTLTDKAGTVINSRTAVVISGLSTSNTIGLSGNDLAISAAETNLKLVERRLLVEFTYTSTLGAGLPGTQEFIFSIVNFAGI